MRSRRSSVHLRFGRSTVPPQDIRLEVYAARQGCIPPPVCPQRLVGRVRSHGQARARSRRHDGPVEPHGVTLTETVRMLEPIGIDRWPIELSHKFVMRDALTCSVGRRWLVSYWSSKPLHNVLTQPGRILLFAAASFAALRLEQLIDHDPRWMGKKIIASPLGSLRSCVWFRLEAHRRDSPAPWLGRGDGSLPSQECTVKLGVRNSTQAACEAIRQNLIP